MPHPVRPQSGGEQTPTLSRSLSATVPNSSKAAANSRSAPNNNNNDGTPRRAAQPRLHQDPEVVHALVHRLQTDIRELLLARNAIQAEVDAVDAEIATLRKSDPFADSHAVLSRYTVGNLKPGDLAPSAAGAGGGSSSNNKGGAANARPGRILSVDEEILMLQSFLEKNKFNQVSQAKEGGRKEERETETERQRKRII